MDERKRAWIRKDGIPSDLHPSMLWAYLISESVLLIVLLLCGVRLLWALPISIVGSALVALIWGAIWGGRHASNW
jgi:hypothetical protein